jgi:hypothetical protein
MRVDELRQALSAVEVSREVLGFIRRPGAFEPEVFEVAEVADALSEDGAFVIYVDAAD